VDETLSHLAPVGKFSIHLSLALTGLCLLLADTILPQSHVYGRKKNDRANTLKYDSSGVVSRVQAVSFYVNPLFRRKGPKR
jgi:hypothetical protein